MKLLSSSIHPLSRLATSALGSVLGVCAALLLSAASGLAASFTVTTTVDGGAGSLRQALLDANAAVEPSVITFNIQPPGRKSIALTGRLPALIAEFVTLDATTQPGYAGRPIIELNGAGIPGGIASGLVFSNVGVAVVRGLVFNRFARHGLEFVALTNGLAGTYSVVGCHIGVDFEGTNDLGNGGTGIRVFGAVASLTVGGAQPGEGNIVSANIGAGISVAQTPTDSLNIVGNLIGVDATGTRALGNHAGGIVCPDFFPGLPLGAIVANVIGANGAPGGISFITGGPALISSNAVGTDWTGTLNLGNVGPGIRLGDGDATTVGPANLIAFNQGAGLVVIDDPFNSPGVKTVTGNSFHSNAGLSLDLRADGVTLNDPGDTDTGPNGLQNFPVLTSATNYGGRLSVRGTVQSRPTTTYFLEFFGNAECDPSGHGEGGELLGSTYARTDGSGNAAFSVALPNDAGWAFITGTASGMEGTSEFSACVTVVNGGALPAPVTHVVTTTSDGGAGSLRQALADLQARPGVVTNRVIFNIPGAPPFLLRPASALPLIQHSVEVDATTQPGYTGTPRVEIRANNSGAGVSGLFLAGASGGAVRGLAIGGFSDYGLRIEGGGGHRLEGNYVGLDTTGTNVFTNAAGGIAIISSRSNIVGGLTADRRNVIVSGSPSVGVPQVSSIRLQHATSSGNQILGNWIGLDATGQRAVGAGIGIDVNGAPGNWIGNGQPGAGNLVALTNLNGIGIRISGSAGNRALGNWIGLDPTGLSRPAAARTRIGLQLNSSSNWIGGTGPGEGNVVGACVVNGLETINGTSNNVIAGNLFGLNPAGTLMLTNGTGLSLQGAGHVMVQNIVSGSTNDGVTLRGSDHRLFGNRVGTDRSGQLARPNAGAGIRVLNGSVTIGGPNPADANVLSGNAGHGLLVSGASVTNLTIQGNVIGLAADRSMPLPNGGDGVLLTNTSSSTTNRALVGGSEFGAGNVIAYNAGHGIFVAGVSPFSVDIQGNAIFLNGRSGIDLGPDGVTPNDPGDADVGPNLLQNFPLLTLASNSGPNVVIQGTLNSRPSLACRLDFYASATCDPSGHGEGEAHMGTASVTTDGAGLAVFSVLLPSFAPDGAWLTATATDPQGNTSEFSPCQSIIGSAPPVELAMAAAGASLVLTWSATAVGYDLEWASTLDPPIPWQAVTNGIMAGPRSASYTITNTHVDPARFYRLRLW